jgi:hypothetical protein
MLQAIAIATARLFCFVFNRPTDRFTRLILEVLGDDLQPPIADQ